MTFDHHPRIPRSVIASSAALLCLLAACGEVSRADRADNGGGAGGAVGAGQGGGRQTNTPEGGGNAAAATMTGGGSSVANSAGAGAGAGAGASCAAAPGTCAPSMGGASSSGDASPVGPPPNGFFVYLAETASQGKQAFQVRVHSGVVAPAVRLTPDAGVDGYAVIPQRPAIITVTGQTDAGYRLTLVDFDESGTTGSLPLRGSASEADSDLFSSFGTNSDGSFLFASPGVRFFDLRPSMPTSQAVTGYHVTAAYGWTGSRLLFSGTKAGTGEDGWFSADPGASPPAATLLTGSIHGPLGFAIAPNQARAIYPSKSSSGDLTWHLLDLTAATPAPVQLTAAALRAPVTSGINAWSPDSRYYLVQVDPGGLVLVDVEHPSRAQVVSAEGATKFTFASFSPDSRRLVYVASHSGWQTTQLYGVTLEPDGPSAAYPLIRGTEDEQAAYVTGPNLFEWMHDSRYVFYLAQNPSAFYLADAYGCSGRRVRLKPEQSEPFTLNGIRSAPNARRAAFFSDYERPGTATRVYVADIDDEGSWGEPTRISGPGDAGLAQELRFLDEDWLMFYAEDAARHASMYLAPRDGSTPARLLNDPKDAILYTTWVPDPP